MTPSQFAAALAGTESNDNVNAPLGDHGCAMGRFQAHPDWVDTWSKHYDLWARDDETWDSRIERLVEAFADDHLQWLSAVEVAMYFHLGHRAIPTDKDWDAAYAKRFTICSGWVFPNA